MYEETISINISIDVLFQEEGMASGKVLSWAYSLWTMRRRVRLGSLRKGKEVENKTEELTRSQISEAMVK